MCKVTVALSVYNVSKYVKASLDCIVNQTHRDMEIICIDDASTDGTWAILEEYAAKDSRIRLFRQEKNHGLSVSRNLAIKEAQGEFLLMLDGDDLFAPNMVEKAYRKAKDTGADMVLWDYVSFYDEKEIPAKCAKPSTLLNLNAQDKLSLLRRPAFSPSRMTKLSVLRDLHIHFPEGLTKQDIPVHWKLVTSLEKIALIPEYFLYYRQSPGNTSSRKGKSVFSLAYVMDITKQQLLQDGIYDLYWNEFLRSRLNLLQGMFDFVKPELKEEALAIIKDRLDENAKTYLHSKECECGSRTKMFFKGYFLGDKWERMKYTLLMKARSLYRLIKR